MPLEQVDLAVIPKYLVVVVLDAVPPVYNASNFNPPIIHNKRNRPLICLVARVGKNLYVFWQHLLYHS